MAWDWGQMFTPPKSKSPWTAMTAGSTDEFAEQAEPWGPVIMAAMSKIPYVGPILGAAGGAMGMGGRGTGYLGSDYGDANWGSTIGGAVSGAYGGNPYTAMPGAIQGNYAIATDEREGENSVNPEANEYNSSWYGGLFSGLGQNASRIGGNYGGASGSQAGGQIGGQFGIFNSVLDGDRSGGMSGDMLGSGFQQSSGTGQGLNYDYMAEYKKRMEEEEYNKKLKEMLDKYLEDAQTKNKSKNGQPKAPNRRLTPVEEYRLTKTMYGETPKYSFMAN